MYDPSNLSALTYANGFTLWSYKTPDDSANVLEDGYFNDAASMLRTGDFLCINANSGALVESGMAVVTSNSAGVVKTDNVGTFVSEGDPR